MWPLPDTLNPKFVLRPAETQAVRLRLHHRGHFVNDPVKLYVGGLVTETNWDWDVGLMSYMQIEELVKAEGYWNIKSIWYCNPKLSFSRGLRTLNNDKDVLRFVEDVKGFKVVDVYVEHKVEEVNIEDIIPDEANEEVIPEQTNEEVNEQEEANEQENFEGADEQVNVEGANEQVNVEEANDQENVEEVDDPVNVEEANYSVNVEEVDDQVNAEEVDDQENVEEAHDEENVEEAHDEANVEEAHDEANVEGDVDDEESETDPDYSMSSEEFEDFEEDVSDVGPDVTVDWTAVLPKTTAEQSSRLDANSDLESCDSDVLVTPVNSDGEDDMQRFPTFKYTTKLEIGMMFKDKLQIKDAIKEFAMENKKNLVFRKNDNKRMVVTCVEGCPFYVRFSMRSTNQHWQIVSFTDRHTCHRTTRNRQATTEWLGRKLVTTMRHTPEMKIKGVIAEVMAKWGVKLSRDQAYRAKKKAIELIQGAGREQFKHLRSYTEELLKSNPNSTVKIQCDDSDAGPIFVRMYVCLEACKAAFATTCRPLIGLDACFLKGDFGGQLIGVVGRDGNNKIYPIAYAVVEAETKDSWQWFLNLLIEDLHSIQIKNYGFISDQQKGLVPAILESSQHVEHRACVKHLYGNWRKKYPGILMKEVLWRAARATTLPGWERAMNRMKELNPNAWKDMMDVPAACWTRSHFRTDTQCDLQVNNMCEAFNRAILEYRDKPIITLLEGIKHYLTVISTQKEKLGRCTWIATWHSDDDFAIFGVSNGVDTFPVNLIQNKCGCRRWDLTGIPCCHAITCIWFNKKDPEDYVASYYRKSNVMATYSHIIMPTNGPQLWPVNVSHPINPPVMRRSIRRPKKNRNKENDEPRIRNTLPRTLQTVKCKKCGNFGHNKRTCKGKRAAERSIPKGGNKKAEKNADKSNKDAGLSVIEGGSQAPPPTQE